MVRRQLAAGSEGRGPAATDADYGCSLAGPRQVVSVMDVIFLSKILNNYVSPFLDLPFRIAWFSFLLTNKYFNHSYAQTTALYRFIKILAALLLSFWKKLDSVKTFVAGLTRRM
jgi:hypothetical protein